MAFFSGTVRASIRAAADLVGALHKISLGTPGTKVKYPTSISQPQFQLDSGGAWSAPPSIVQYVLDHVGAELDLAHATWAYITTNATGIAPTIQAARGVGASSKNEATDVLSVALSTSYINNYYFASGLVDGATPYICGVITKTSGAYDLRFFDAAGAAIDINNRSVVCLSVGRV